MGRFCLIDCMLTDYLMIQSIHNPPTVLVNTCFLALVVKNSVCLHLTSDLLPKQFACALVMFKGVLNGLNLHGNCREYSFL